MSHKNERFLRANNPKEINGLDQQKINDAIGTIIHRVSQKGKTIQSLEIALRSLFSVAELKQLAVKLARSHNLGLLIAHIDERWRDYIRCYSQRKAVQY